jgi:3-isopropylmalate/(R)-2-methylmalate dehydratase large subunit
MGTTLFDKIWKLHEVAAVPGGASLLHVDRHLVHELTGVEAIQTLEARGLSIRNPDLTFATLDHVLSTRPGRLPREGSNPALLDGLREQTARLGIERLDLEDGRQGIVHVVGPELGLSLPGMLIVCGDSHTCTHGALGAMAWGIGSSELVHVFATQTIRQRRPKTMRITLTGDVAPGVQAKDVILHVIGRIGAAGGTGYAVEFAGSVIRRMDMEGRMTFCNLSIELGARVGMIAPDETTFQYVAGRPFAPRGAMFQRAIESWADLPSDPDAVFDREASIDVSGLRPQVTWGTSPEHVVAVDGTVPDPAHEADPARREAMLRALTYMRLTPGQRMTDVPIDRVFIGSCTNARISDLRSAAAVVKGRRVAPGVRAWVAPGSLSVQREATAEGLDRVFRDAGFEWREPGCSMCVGANGDIAAPGERCLSTSNRNFIGRQGPGALTHLASPAVAAASAIAGVIAMPTQGGSR